MNPIASLKATVAKIAYGWLVDATNPREQWRRPQEIQTVNSLPQEVSLSDWLGLVSDSRKLFANLGPAKGAICDKNTYAVGRAWDPKFLGQDQAWGKQAETWLREMWYPTADVRGGMFDFKTDLYIAGVSTDRDGEVYILLTESPDGWPQIQLIPATQIGNGQMKDGIIESGPYRGLRMMQGVIVNPQGRAVAYNVLGYERADDRIISARDLIQVYDPEWADQVRGLPVFTHAILDLKDLRQTQGYEKMACALASSIGLIEHNELGAPDPNDPMNVLKRQPSDAVGVIPSVTTQEVTGITARFFRAGSNSKLEAFKSDRPGDAWAQFMDRLIRNACTGAGWPFELTWDSSKLGGANVRLLVARAMRTIEDRQDLLRPIARRVAGYAVAKAIKRGDLPPNPEWYAWGFQMPARMTVDFGRDGKSTREDYILGLTNLGDILAEEGKGLDQHIADRAVENEKLRVAGLPVPVPPGAQAPAEAEEDEDDEEEKKDERRRGEMAAMFAALRPASPQVTVHPPNVSVAPSPVTVNVPAQAAPVVQFTAEPPQVTVQPAQVNVTFEAPEPTVVNVAAPTVAFEAPAPLVVPAPVVNVENQINVPAVAAKLELKRDKDGRVRGGDITPQ